MVTTQSNIYFLERIATMANVKKELSKETLIRKMWEAGQNNTPRETFIDNLVTEYGQKSSSLEAKISNVRNEFATKTATYECQEDVKGDDGKVVSYTLDGKAVALKKGSKHKGQYIMAAMNYSKHTELTKDDARFVETEAGIELVKWGRGGGNGGGFDALALVSDLTTEK